jgi:hypothetical protein
MLKFEVIAAVILAIFAIIYVIAVVAPDVLPAAWLERLPL